MPGFSTDIIRKCDSYFFRRYELFFELNCFCGRVDRQKALALFPAGTNVRDLHHQESPTVREQDWNLRIT